MTSELPPEAEAVREWRQLKAAFWADVDDLPDEDEITLMRRADAAIHELLALLAERDAAIRELKRERDEALDERDEKTVYAHDLEHKLELARAELHTQLSLNAGLLAKQSDLRMDAESRAMRAERERDSILSACERAGWHVTEGDPEGFIVGLAARVADAFDAGYAKAAQEGESAMPAFEVFTAPDGEPATRMVTWEARAARWEWVARYVVVDRTLGIHPDPATFADKLASWPEGEQVLTALLPVAVAHTESTP